MTKENFADRRPTFSASVGVIPLCQNVDGTIGILLGQRSEDGLWTPIAGGLEIEEDDLDALGREWLEETGLDPEKSLKLYPLPFNTFSPYLGKTSIGITYLGEYTGPKLPYKPQGDGEIALIESFSPQKLKNLVNYPERVLFRPDINLPNLTAMLALLSPQDGMEAVLLNRARQSTQRFINEDTIY